MKSGSRGKELEERRDFYQAIEDKFLLFAKKACNFNSWFENSEEDLREPPRCHSIEEIKVTSVHIFELKSSVYGFSRACAIVVRTYSKQNYFNYYFSCIWIWIFSHITQKDIDKHFCGSNRGLKIQSKFTNWNLNKYEKFFVFHETSKICNLIKTSRKPRKIWYYN